MNSILLNLTLTFAIFSAGPAMAAPDKIGNGGGTWVCQNSGGEIFDIMFMDIFEAKREYLLEVPESTTPYLQQVQAQKDWINRFLMPRSSVILPHIEYVEKNITWIQDVINLIPDGANKISPHPSTCRQGKWEPVQLVNFTDDFRILVRQDLFKSDFLSEVERAAVYLHEGLYSYLRTEYQDQNSVRARAIVGFLFSNLPDPEKVQRIEKVLSQTPNPVDPEPAPIPARGWICGIKPGRSEPLYIGEGIQKPEAFKSALDACEKGQDPAPGFPFPIPKPPGGGRCKEAQVLCEQILSANRDHVCEVSKFGGEGGYRGNGRTRLEALYEAMNRCSVAEGSVSCYINESRCDDEIGRTSRW